MVLAASLPDAESLARFAPVNWRADGWAQIQFRAMGTECQIMVKAPSLGRAKEFRNEIVGWVLDFERKYSRFREDSLISEINRQAGVDWVPTDDELESMFLLCDTFHWKTTGVFDPTSLPVLKLWDYHQESPALPTEDAVKQAMERVGWSRVQRERGAVFLPEKGMCLDLGGIGKEYAVDRVFEQAAAAGFSDVMVDFGRDVRVGGEAPGRGGWRVGLEHPLDPGRCWGGVLVTQRAVTTSGDYLRGFTINGQYFGHIIDPRTGYPTANGCRAVTVIAPTCTEAGIFSTAGLILGREEGLNLISRHSMLDACLWAGEQRFETYRFHRHVIS